MDRIEILLDVIGITTLYIRFILSVTIKNLFLVGFIGVILSVTIKNLFLVGLIG